LKCAGRIKTCYGEVTYHVKVTDRHGVVRTADVFIRWCTDKTSRNPLGGKPYRALPNGLPCTNPLSEDAWKDVYDDIKRKQADREFLKWKVGIEEGAIHGIGSWFRHSKAARLSPPAEP
jgi:hypothetical protein